MDGRQLVSVRLTQAVPASTSVETIQALPHFDEPVVAELCALDPGDDRELARDCAWTEPFKFYRLGAARIDIAADGQALLLSTDKPVKGLWLAGNGLQLADNFIDLVPGAPRRLMAEVALPESLRVVAVDHATRRIDLFDRGGQLQAE
jgi:beta-mannosidase